MTHRFTTSLNYEEYLAANWLMVRRRMLWRGLTRMFLILWAGYSILMMAVCALDNDVSMAAAVWSLGVGLAFAVLVSVVLVLISLWRLPRAAKKSWPQHHLDGLPTFHEFDAVGIRISNERGSSNFDWPMLTSWTEDDRLLLMFRTKLMFHAVPKAQVPAEELDALKALLVSSGVSTKC